MAAFNLAPIGNGFQFFTPGGVVLFDGYLATYAAGTTTPLATYTTSLGGPEWPTLIPLGTDGRVDGEIWFAAGVAYKFVLIYADGVTPVPNCTWDNLVGINDNSSAGSTFGWQASGFTPIYSGASVFTNAGNSTAVFIAGTRVQFTVSAGTVYGAVKTSVFSGGATTVTMQMDPGSALDAGLTVANIAPILPLMISNYFADNLYAPAVFATSFTGNLTGNVTGNVTGNLTGTASAATLAANSTEAYNISTSNTAVTLGAAWSVNSLGNLVNNGNTMLIQAAYSSASTGSGTIVDFDTSIFMQGTLAFTITSGTIAFTNPGLYEVEAVVLLTALSSPVFTNMYFGGTRAAVYGPNSSGTGLQLNIPIGAYVTAVLKALVSITVTNQTVTVVSTATFSGANYNASAGAQILIRQVG